MRGLNPRQRQALIKRLLRVDGPWCKLCDGPLNPSAGPRDPMRPTLDHILPKSKGGRARPHNLQLAHWKCNQDKGDETCG